MAWPLILAITFLVINIALFASTFYQILLLTDLEADYINMYEAASRINGLILPDFILQGVLSVLLLMTGHWFMFLVSVPVTCYHVMLYIKQRHLIDVTEVFRVLTAEKKYRMVKLGLLSVLFLMVIFRPFVISRSPVWRFRYSLIVPGVLEIICFSFSHLRRLVLSIFESFVDDEDALHSF